jgi:hypothetical protein
LLPSKDPAEESGAQPGKAARPRAGKNSTNRRVMAKLSDSCGQSMGTGAMPDGAPQLRGRSVKRRSATDLGVISNPDEVEMSARTDL